MRSPYLWNYKRSRILFGQSMAERKQNWPLNKQLSVVREERAHTYTHTHTRTHTHTHTRTHTHTHTHICIYIYLCIYTRIHDYIYSFRFFQLSVSWWIFTGVWVTASLLQSPGIFSVFWPFSIMLLFGWSPLGRQLSNPPGLLIIL